MINMRLFDTHAHMLDDRFDEDRDTLVSQLPQKRVRLMLEAGCYAGEIPDQLALADCHAHVFTSVGVHPHEAADMGPDDLDVMSAAASHPKVVAVGEIGLDYHYDHAPRPIQRARFAEQLDFAEAHKLPVIIHSREAQQDTLELLKARKNKLRGVMHCFSGSLETAKECLKLGLYISFAGPVTFHNAERLWALAEWLPLDRMLIETDCPYLAPEPHRGKRNDPSYVSFVCEKIAEIRHMEPEAFAEAAFINGCTLFGIDASKFA